MLVAPAGYGKTTLARQWLSNRRHAWYAATAESSDIAAFGRGIAEAAIPLLGDVQHRFREALLAHADVDGDLAADFLSSDLAAWPQGAWLAIDDYQWLTDGGEKIVERLSAIPTMHLLVTSRTRPAWATPRQLLYGELYELGQTALAMSNDEANEVLNTMEASTAQGLVALADGWPAVIGLASFASPSSFLDAVNLPPELHAYIADELFESVTPTSQEALCALSLLPVVTSDVAQSLVGADGRHAIAEGTRVGFLAEEAPGALYIHPLLRAFLRRKFNEVADESRRVLMRRAIDLLISRGSWEGALEVVDAFEDEVGFNALLRAALYPLLEEGRSSTIKKLVHLGQALAVNSPILDLARAELAFLQGFHEQARELAEDAGARLLGEDDLMATKAFFRAGQSAYFSDDPEGAIQHYSRARALGGEKAYARTAIWGHFLASVECEHENAPDLLHEFVNSGLTSVDDRVRAQTGKLHLATRFGSLWATLAAAEHTALIVSGARDPTVRAAFWHAYAGGLRVAGRYHEALTATDKAIEEVDTFHLEFARTHIKLARAGIYLGTRRYDEAFGLLDEIEAVGRSRADIYLQLNECTLRCRAHLLLGEAEAAVHVTDRQWPHVPSTGQFGEFLACSALAYRRAGGDVSEVRARLDVAEKASRENEATHLSMWGKALISTAEPEESALAVHTAFQEAWRSGVLDPLVFAYRLEPRRLKNVLKSDTNHPLRDFVRRLDEPDERRSSAKDELLDGLTPREREVLALLAASKSNREIAEQLYVTEATVKVHVRHILRKLGVRTRTEAAVRAVKTRWLEESEEPAGRR
jgi:ATP/maltotriose-dependent transcriptional regulator MalT